MRCSLYRRTTLVRLTSQIITLPRSVPMARCVPWWTCACKHAYTMHVSVVGREAISRGRSRTRCIQLTDETISCSWHNSVTYGGQGPHTANGHPWLVSCNIFAYRTGLDAHPAGVGVPQVDRLVQADRQQVRGGPVHQVQVEVILTVAVIVQRPPPMYQHQYRTNAWCHIHLNAPASPVRPAPSWGSWGWCAAAAEGTTAAAASAA